MVGYALASCTVNQRSHSRRGLAVRLWHEVAVAGKREAWAGVAEAPHLGHGLGRKRLEVVQVPVASAPRAEDHGDATE